MPTAREFPPWNRAPFLFRIRRRANSSRLRSRSGQHPRAELSVFNIHGFAH